jgi:hypothetical protein
MEVDMAVGASVGVEFWPLPWPLLTVPVAFAVAVTPGVAWAPVVAVGSGEDVAVAIGEDDGVLVGEGDGVCVGLGVGVGVFVGVGEGVFVGVGEGVSVGVGEGVFVAVGVSVGVLLGVGDGVFVAAGVSVEVASGDAGWLMPIATCIPDWSAIALGLCVTSIVPADKNTSIKESTPTKTLVRDNWEPLCILLALLKEGFVRRWSIAPPLDLFGLCAVQAWQTNPPELAA